MNDKSPGEMALACMILFLLMVWPSNSVDIASVQASFTITKLADTNDGVCDADCSLREALAAAPPDSNVVFANGLQGKVTLGSTLDIIKSVTISGSDKGSIVINGNSNIRMFDVYPGVAFTINNLTIVDGLARGTTGSMGGSRQHTTPSGDSNKGRMTGPTMQRGGQGSNATGGGLYNNGGIVTVINSTFSGNRAIGGGGAMGAVDLSAPGGAGGDGMGGALYNLGTVFLINSTFSGNRASGGGGGMGAVDFSAPGGAGGNGMGGALYNLGTVFIVNTTFSGNIAIGGSGGDRNGRDYKISQGGPGGNGFGGAIYSTSELSLSSCTLMNNAALGGGGGIGGHGGAVGLWGHLGAGKGGAIYRLAVVAKEKTWAMNRSPGIAIKNTLISNNGTGGSCEALTISGGYNIDSDGTCNLKAIGDISNIEAKLGPLAGNGGPTSTHALMPGSPAINNGNPEGCTDHQNVLIPTDQRGFSRSWEGRCDIGAFEFSRQLTTAKISSRNIFFSR